MSINNEQQKQLEELFKEKLQEQYNRGLHVGVLSVSKVVLDKLNDGSKQLMKRINDVKKFCETPLNKQKKIEQALKDASAKVEQVADTSLDENTGENATENG